MRPVIWNRRDLTLSHLMMRHLSRLLDYRAMIVRGIQHGQRPDARSASCHQHERTVHQTRRPASLSRLLRQTVPRTIVAPAITSQPHLGRPPRLLLSRSTRGFDDNIISMGLSMALDSSQQRRPSTKPCQYSTRQPPFSRASHSLVRICPFRWRYQMLQGHIRNILKVARRIQVQISGVRHDDGDLVNPSSGTQDTKNDDGLAASKTYQHHDSLLYPSSPGVVPPQPSTTPPKQEPEAHL